MQLSNKRQMAAPQRLAKPVPRQSADPERDPGGVWERQVKQFALAKGIRDARALVDEWIARADCRWYAGDQRDEANALAYQDVTERFSEIEP